MLERTSLGGQAGFSRRIENYLGFPGGITGADLTAVPYPGSQVRRADGDALRRRLARGSGTPTVSLEEGNEVSARAVMLANGADYNRLPVEGLGDYEGISVFYSAGLPRRAVWREPGAVSAAATPPGRRRSGSREGARW